MNITKIMGKEVVGPAIGDEVITIAPDKIQARIQQGRAYVEEARYIDALREFDAILEVAPGNIETRILVRKVKDKLDGLMTEEVAEKKITPLAEEAKPKECIWMKLGMVSYRICTRNYDCLACEFDQTIQEEMASGETPELDAILERFKELPGNQRLCRYAIKGDISYRLCTHLFQCATCEFAQMIEDDLQRKLAKLAARRNALGKKKQLIKEGGYQMMQATIIQEKPIAPEDKLRGRETILAVLARAAEDSDFLAQLTDNPTKALGEYTLTQEEKAALASGDIKAIEGWVGKLDKQHATWLWCRLSQEKW